MGDTIFVVELHESNYDGPKAVKVAADADVAMRVADSMRDEHRGEDWDMRVRGRDGRATVSFSPTDGPRGWVRVREKPLIRD